MRIHVIASTSFYGADQTPYKRHSPFTPGDSWASSEDELPEFAGRACYESYGRPNPTTATNAGYLGNILDQQHESVLEHSSVSFYVEGVSRSLLAELSRHRHLSFSVLSQRYVKLDRERFVTPPLIEEYGDEIAIRKMYENFTINDIFEDALDEAFEAYEKIADALIAKGVPRKKALEAARSVLPQATESPMVVTGNLRAWRDVLKKRHHVAADAEIQLFAAEILRNLRNVAPNSVQDIPDQPYGSDPEPDRSPPSTAKLAPNPPATPGAAASADIPFKETA